MGKKASIGHTSRKIATLGLYEQGYRKVGAGDSLFGQYWTWYSIILLVLDLVQTVLLVGQIITSIEGQIETYCYR